MRTNSKETTKKWLLVLNEIKNELNNNNHNTLQKFIDKNKISASWRTFLKNHNVIYKENGYYKWNEKIPVCIKLIEYFRIYSRQWEYKNKKQELNLFNMPSSAKPPRPKVRKTRTPKVEVQFYDEPKIELGVIRRFLKWLW